MEFLTSCLKVCDEAKDKGGSANLLSGIADLQLQIGQVNERIESLEEALDIYKQLGNYFAQAGELDILAKVYTKLGKKKRADDYKKESKKIQVEKGFELTCLSKVNALRVNDRNHQGKSISFCVSLTITACFVVGAC